MLRFILPLFFLAIQSSLVISWDERICKQEIVKGPCKGHIERYAFNTTSGECDQFIYGGCKGNENNFETLDDCQKVCQNNCLLPMDKGRCKANVSRYYYNKDTRQCEKFIYGGCKGNSNNFESKEDCEAHCVIITNPQQ